MAEPDLHQLALRMTAATAAGALVGIEREAHGQLAGIRTNALVAVGACLYTLLGAHGFPDLDRASSIDPMRVAAQVVSGIGFIGAGAIIRDRGAIRGVTTAAALWVSAALGMAAGAGLITALAVGVSTTLVALIGLRFVRDHVLRRITHRRHTITVTYAHGHDTLGPLITAINESGAKLQTLRIVDDAEQREVHLDVLIRNTKQLNQRLQTITDGTLIAEISYN